MKNNSVNYFEFGPVVQEEMPFKGIHNWSSGNPFVQKCYLKVFLIWSSGSPFVQQSITTCAILVDGIMRNNLSNYFELGSVVQEEM